MTDRDARQRLNDVLKELWLPAMRGPFFRRFKRACAVSTASSERCGRLHLAS